MQGSIERLPSASHNCSLERMGRGVWVRKLINECSTSVFCRHTAWRGKKKKGKGAVCVKRRQLSEREQREQREGEESERQMDMEVWREALKGAMVPGDEAG